MSGHCHQLLTVKGLSAVVYTLQCSWAYAAPEVLAYNLDPCVELFEKINFQSQDCWSLGCLLIWLLIGRDPFSMSVEERAQHGDLDASELQHDLRRKQLTWVSCAAGCIALHGRFGYLSCMMLVCLSVSLSVLSPTVCPESVCLSWVCLSVCPCKCIA